jgi:hypothetical protein
MRHNYVSGDTPLPATFPFAPNAAALLLESDVNITSTLYGEGFFLVTVRAFLEQVPPTQHLEPDTVARGSHIRAPSVAYRGRDAGGVPSSS